MTDTPNTLFPGLPGYAGPVEGWFSILHHEGPLVEWSDNVIERVDYIKHEKPKNEVETRLNHIVYLGKRGDDYWAKLKPLGDDYWAKVKALDDDYQAKVRALDDGIIAYIRPLILDFAWAGKELRFQG